jgi:hypothetical protein
MTPKQNDDANKKLNPLTLEERRAIVQANCSDDADIGKDDSYKVGESNVGLTRLYQGNLMVGSSTWLMWYGSDVETYNGWHILEAMLPPQYFGFPLAALHAYKAGWTSKEVSWHMWDKNCATNILELSEAIDYWNEQEAFGEPYYPER